MNTQFKSIVRPKGIDFDSLKRGDVFEYMDEDGDVQHGMKVTASLDDEREERYDLYVDLDLDMVFNWCDKFTVTKILNVTLVEQ
jgi:hypothetical protein